MLNTALNMCIYLFLTLFFMLLFCLRVLLFVSMFPPHCYLPLVGEICPEISQVQFGAPGHQSVLQTDQKNKIHRQLSSQQQSQSKQEPKDTQHEV